jgi:hypothetical protein
MLIGFLNQTDNYLSINENQYVNQRSLLHSALSCFSPPHIHTVYCPKILYLYVPCMKCVK